MLEDERYEVNFQVSKEKNGSKTIEYSRCINLDIFLANQSFVNLNDLNLIIYNYFKNLETKIDNLKNFQKNVFKRQLNSVLENVKRRNYYIYDDRFCLLTSMRTIFYLIFNEFFKSPILLLLDKNTNKLNELNDFSFFKRIAIMKISKPFSNCSKDFDKFFCLNNCAKSRQNLSSYYYTGNANQLIHLKNQKNESVFKDENSCIEKCPKENCELSFYVPR